MHVCKDGRVHAIENEEIMSVRVYMHLHACVGVWIGKVTFGWGYTVLCRNLGSGKNSYLSGESVYVCSGKSTIEKNIGKLRVTIKNNTLIFCSPKSY